MTGSLLGVLGSPWHWHAWHVGLGWPFVGLFWVGLWVVMLALLSTALWRRRGSFTGGAFSRPGPGSGPMGAAMGGPMGGTAQVGRSFPTGSPGEPLRASTEEREATVRVLSDAMADGRLSSEEHSERVSAAYAARYRHELAAMIADLPGAKAPHLQDAATATTPRPGRLVGPVALPLLLVAFLLATFGAWHFGPFLLLALGIWFVVRVRRRLHAPTLR